MRDSKGSGFSCSRAVNSVSPGVSGKSDLLEVWTLRFGFEELTPGRVHWVRRELAISWEAYG